MKKRNLVTSVSASFLVLFVMLTQPALAVGRLPNQLVHHDDQTGLRGWRNEPTSYSKNRIVPIAEVFESGVVFTTLVRDKGFSDGIRIALAREGIDDINILSAKRFVSEQMAQVNALIFSDPTLDIYWFMAEGRKNGERIKIAGHAITTPPHSKDPERGTNFKMFAAPDQIYEALGGARTFRSLL